MLTAVFTAEHLAAAARRTGCVTRASQMSGTRLLALVTCGVWKDATTTRAPWAAKVTPGDEPRAIAPAAMEQRLHKGALACLQDMIRYAHVHVLENVWDDGLVPSFTHVYRADSTGFELPESLHALFPGSGGSAAQAGATMHAVWDDTSRVGAHGAWTPWHRPAQPFSDTVVA